MPDLDALIPAAIEAAYYIGREIAKLWLYALVVGLVLG